MRLATNALPAARGEISAGLIDALRDSPRRAGEMPVRAARQAGPYQGDLQLALYLCYELHYRGIAGVSDEWEWNPALLELRGELEARFLGGLRADVEPHEDVGSALDVLLAEPVNGTSLSHFLRDEGELWQLREYAALRSLYHLKEADPEAWAIPRLTGRAKAGLVAVEYDEYGAGRADRIHAKLYADLMADLGLDNRYGHYLEAGTAEMLAVVNLMSLFGLHRSLRGALAGHYATVEVTSSPACRRLAKAMERVGAGPAAVRFYTEHVEADAVHEQLARREIIGGLLEDEPELESDVVFGIDATGWVEDRFGAALLTAWRDGRSSLRVPL
ncbi:MAG: iron-containing redox enzyme family protein [Streptosporangiaceae bacterium]|nr:iron-containing redox enzyme family protein [Streptosporangiaceae bacterium]